MPTILGMKTRRLPLTTTRFVAMEMFCVGKKVGVVEIKSRGVGSLQTKKVLGGNVLNCLVIEGSFVF